MSGKLKLRIEMIQELILQVKHRGDKLTIDICKKITEKKNECSIFLLLNASFYDNMNV